MSASNEGKTTLSASAQQNLERFFRDMAGDPAKREEYTSAPLLCMQHYQLDENCQNYVQQGDSEAIWRELGNGGEQPIPIVLISAYNK